MILFIPYSCARVCVNNDNDNIHHTRFIDSIYEHVNSIIVRDTHSSLITVLIVAASFYTPTLPSLGWPPRGRGAREGRARKRALIEV